MVFSGYMPSSGIAGSYDSSITVGLYTMEYYSAIKGNKIVSFAETWMDLETVIQSEVSQKQNNK